MPKCKSKWCNGDCYNVSNIIMYTGDPGTLQALLRAIVAKNCIQIGLHESQSCSIKDGNEECILVQSIPAERGHSQTLLTRKCT